MMKNKILFLDTETGGLNPINHDLLSFGLVVWENGKILAEKEILLFGRKERTSGEGMAVNRIDLDRHNARALQPDQAANEMLRFIEHHFGEKPVIVGGHNVGFDMTFVRLLFDRLGLDFSSVFSHRYIDTSSILQYLGIRRHLSNRELQAISSSDQAFSDHGIHILPEERHTALGDARATADLFSALLHYNGAESPSNGIEEPTERPPSIH